MNLRKPLVFRLARFDLGQAGHRTALFKLLHDRAQPIGGLRMSGAHIMLEIGGMINQTSITHQLTRNVEIYPCSSRADRTAHEYSETFEVLFRLSRRKLHRQCASALL